MEIMDGVDTDRWEVRMVMEEKWRRKSEGREISNSYKKAKKSRQFQIAFLSFSQFDLQRAPNY